MTARSWQESLLVAAFVESPMATLRTSVVEGHVDRILDANPAACRLLGADDLHGLRLSDLIVAGSLMAVAEQPTQHLLAVPGDEPADPHGAEAVRWLEATVAALSTEGSPGAPAALVLLHDVTERHALDRRRDQAQAQDLLTGLANRHELSRRLATFDGVVDGPRVSALFVDLDRFKRINDERGHAAGDELLVAVAQRLRSVVRPEDTVARIGGDEFVVLCPRLGTPDDARAIAERVRVAVAEPLAVRGRDLRITASIGVALAAVDGLDPATLLHAADAAMYAAKQAGRNRIAFDPRSQSAGRRLSGLRWGARRRFG